jgi:DNA-binding transcriptional LysR family regulator
LITKLEKSQGEFDVGVRIGRLLDSSLIARRIAPIRLAICAAPDYVARHVRPGVDGIARSEDAAEWRIP